MSQRTRSRTTAATARKRPSSTSSATPSPRARRGGAGAAATQPGNAGAAGIPSPAASAAPSPRGERGPGGEDSSLSPETLARTLRAVAAELERDPALARRVASAIAADTLPAPTSAPAALPAGASSARPDAPPDGSEVTRPTRQRTARQFTPTLVTGVSPDLGPGIPDPFALARRLGPVGLRAALAELRRGTLRAIIREHGIAPAAQVAHITDDAKLRELILAAVARNG